MLLTHTIETDGHTIEAYGRRPHNRNIWSHTIARRRPFVTPGRFFCLRFNSPSTHYWQSIPKRWTNNGEAPTLDRSQPNPWPDQITLLSRTERPAARQR